MIFSLPWNGALNSFAAKEEDKMLLGYMRGKLLSRVSLKERFGDLTFLFHPSSSPPQSPNSL
jgi:hypothetical protein